MFVELAWCVVLFLNCILRVNSVGINGEEERCVLSIANKAHRRTAVLVGQPSSSGIGDFGLNNEFCSYLGIPYARPPIGRLRFEVSVPKMFILYSTHVVIFCGFFFHARALNIECRRVWQIQQPPRLAPLFAGPVKKYFTKVGNICLQMSYSYGGTGENIIGNENCLYLNVHTAYRAYESPPPPPTLTANNKTHRTRNKRSPQQQQQHRQQLHETLLPVVLWIHGGSFNLGSSTSDTNGPDYLVEKVPIPPHLLRVHIYIYNR